jgi:hypothetical protein
MLKQCLENIGEGLLHACISSNCSTAIQVQSNNIILNGFRLLISRQSRRAFARNTDVLLVFSRQLNRYPSIKKFIESNICLYYTVAM